ncbi:MAG: beta-lactamase family protein [Fimbriimonadaceae bacterium]|nr:beta-lactamase family protein [Fimbriimonadaceae bacterium]
MNLLAVASLAVTLSSPVRQASKDASFRLRREGVHKILADTKKERNLNAVLCSVWEGERELTTVALGNSMTGVPATTKMHMRVGGVTLTSLCMVLLRLVDAGKIRLDDRLSRWFPDLPKSNQVTIRMLANCSAGYADYVTDPKFVDAFTKNPFRGWTSKELISTAMTRPMLYDPGKGWNYSHTNFVILGEIMQRVSGMSVPKLLKKHIFDPLGLRESEFPLTAEIKPPVLHAFSLDREVYEDSTYWSPSWTSFSGQMTSTIGDVAAIGRAMGSGRLLSKRSRAEQIAPTVVGLGQSKADSYYGLGIIILNTWMVQNPRFGGYNLILAYLPSKKLTIAISTTKGPKANPDSADSTAIFNALAKFLAPEKPLPNVLHE